jgi:hypothetical protein
LRLGQAAILLKGLDRDFANPRFEAPACGLPVDWKNRGQVILTDGEVIAEVDIIEIRRDDRGLLVLTEGSLWVDGRRAARPSMQMVTQKREFTIKTRAS